MKQLISAVTKIIANDTLMTIAYFNNNGKQDKMVITTCKYGKQVDINNKVEFCLGFEKNIEDSNTIKYLHSNLSNTWLGIA